MTNTTERVEKLKSGIVARVRRSDSFDVISFEASSQPWAILLGGLLGRDDFHSLLAKAGGSITYGIDTQGYCIPTSHVDNFLIQVNELIEKHFPKKNKQ